MLAAGGAWLLYRHHTAAKSKATAKAKPKPTAPVTTATARKGDIGVYVEALGIVTPLATVTVTGRVQGQIMRVNYREGQLVHVGDSLIEIDARPFEAVLTQASGQLTHDRAVLAEARIDLERYREALARNAIPRQQFEDQEQVLLQNQGTVQVDEGTVASARVNLAYCHITSPIDGRVGLRLTDPGNIVQTDSVVPLVSITQIQPTTVIFSVAEDYLSQIVPSVRRGEKLTVDVFDRSQQKLLSTGPLLSLDNLADTTTGTVRLRAFFANTDEALYPNQFVNVRLLIKTLQGVTLLPSAAIQQNAQGPFVYAIKNQTATLQSIKSGTTEGADTSVEGINPDEVVAISGFDKLQDGIKVTEKTKAASGRRAEQ